MKRIISFHSQAVVGTDNAVRLGGMVIDIPEGRRKRGYAKAKVELRQLLDGRWKVYHKATLIAQTGLTPLKEPSGLGPGKNPGHGLLLKSTGLIWHQQLRGDIPIAQ